MALTNPSFEDGATGWTFTGGFSAVEDAGHAHTGTWLARNSGAFGTAGVLNNLEGAVYPGQVVTGSCYVNAYGASDQVGGQVRMKFLTSLGGVITEHVGNTVVTNQGWKKSSASGTAPAGAASVIIQGDAYSLVGGGTVDFDTFAWSYVGGDRTVTILTPDDGAVYEVGEVIAFTASVSGTTPPITSVTYKRGATVIGSSSSAPYAVNTTAIPEGSYVITAELLGADGSVTVSAPIDIVVTAALEEREFKASNSYTYLVAGNFTNLTSSLPPNAIVTGAEIILDYQIDAFIRSKDLGVDDPLLSNFGVAFDSIEGGEVEVILLRSDGAVYTIEGTSMTKDVPIDRGDFSVEEEGLSAGRKWTALSSAPSSVTVGSDDSLFGMDGVSGGMFTDRALGIRFYPQLGTKPAYADAGSACFRFFINKLRLRVYFDAGSADYYFASTDATEVIKGELVASYVADGDFRTADASGVLQLNPTLVVKDGTQTYIEDTWNIHSGYPVTADNKIGEVAPREHYDGVGMSYNGLPPAGAVLQEDSRYQFITANFYGDGAFDSIYGVHGLPRAFAYNGEFFYKIYTQPDGEKDNPRHLAYHHVHLALGYKTGRVDISVAGQPYNFSGVLGASSWAIGDRVTGLLPLSGTILGIFGAKSVWGISGTTVDNFATQVISPKIGAFEYTIVHIGVPVYANTYGIYTLSQTQQYGDYVGAPLSEEVSPWLKPRLKHSFDADKDVVVAWPVRAKNQYRLAFSDGYVLTMTLNNSQQAAPTFSIQQYFRVLVEDESVPSSLYLYPTIVPFALSSELDTTGQERIHMADYPQTFVPVDGGS